MNYRIRLEAKCFLLMILWVILLVVVDLRLITMPELLTPVLSQRLKEGLPGFTIDAAETNISAGTVALAGLSYRIGGVPVLTAPAAQVELDALRGKPLSVTLVGPQISFDLGIIKKLQESAGAGQPIEELPFIEAVGGKLTFADETIFARGKSLKFDITHIGIRRRLGQPFAARGHMTSPLLGDWTFEVSASGGSVSATAECPDFVLGDEFAGMLSERFKYELGRIRPRGHAEVRLRVRVEPDREPDVRISIFPHGMELRYIMFPYLVRNLEGELEFNLKGFEIKRATGTSTTGERIFMSGVADDYEQPGSFAFDLRIEGMKIDAEMLQAVSPGVRRVIKALDATGTLAVQGKVLKKAGRDAEVEVPVVVQLRGCRIKLGAFPYELVDVEGLVEVTAPTARLRNVTGRSGQARFGISGSAVFPERGLGLDIEVHGNGVPIDAKLREALPPEGREILDSLAPTGNFDIEWKVKRDLFGPEKHEFAATLSDGNLRYSSLPLPLKGLTGELRGTFSGDSSEIAWHGMKGKYENAEITSEGRIKETKSGSSGLVEIGAVGIPFGPKVLDALPPELSSILRDAKLAGSGDLRARLVHSTSFAADGLIGSRTIREDMSAGSWPRIGNRRPGVRLEDSFTVELAIKGGSLMAGVTVSELEGSVRLSGQRLDDGRYGVGADIDFHNARVQGKRFNRLSASVSYDHGKLNISGIIGLVYKGFLSGHVNVDLEAKEYSASVQATGVDLDAMRHDIVQYQGKPISGRLDIRIDDLRGTAGNPKSVTGTGDVKVWDANLGQIPVFSYIFDVSKWANPGYFNAGTVKMEAKNGKIALNDVVLKGEGGGVFGKGTMDFDWNLDVELRVNTKILGDFWPFRPLDWLLDNIVGTFVVVKVTGPFDDPKTELRGPLK